MTIESLQKLTYIVINQEILEYRHYVSAFVVDDIVDYFDVVEISRC